MSDAYPQQPAYRPQAPQPYQPQPYQPYQPQQQPQPGYQPQPGFQPQQAPQPGQGLIITLQSPPILLSFAGALTPVITVNGYPIPTARQGRNVVPTHPGPNQVHVHLKYFLPPQLGPADHQHVVAAGQWTELEYKPPMWSFSKGSLGPPPQSYNGLVPMLAVLGGSALFVLLMIFVAAVL